MDGDFSLASLKARYNAELANNLGNLFSRTLTLIDKNFAGVLSGKPEGVLLKVIEEHRAAILQAYEKAAFQEVLEHLNAVVTETNRYIDTNAPWALVKTDLKAAEKVLLECLVVLRWLAVGFATFMPESAAKMWSHIKEESDLLQSGEVFKNPLAGFASGKKLEKPPILFQRKA